MKDTRRNLRCPAHDPAVVSPRAIITIIADLDYGRGREGIAPITLCEDIGIRALCNVIDELVRGINGAGNLREGIGIRASSTTLSSNNLASFYYSRGRYFETSGISMGARALQGIGSNLCSFSKLLIVILTYILYSL